MSNVSATREWVWDTVGVVSDGPIVVRKIVLIPNAAGDTCLFKTWIATAKDHEEQATATVATTNLLQATGLFTSAKVAAGDVVKILYTSTGNNVVTRSVASRDNDNQVTLTGAAMTNEATKVYSWDVYATYSAIEILSQATTKKQEELDFGFQGRVFRNLALTTLSSSAKVYIYLL